MDAFGFITPGEEFSTADFLDQSAFDEKFEIELEKDYINNLFHIENKYLVPVLAGGYRDMYNYCRKNLIHPNDKDYDLLMDPDTLKERLENSPEKGIVKSEFREKLIDGSFRWVEYIGISGIEHGVPEGKIYFYVYDIQNQKDRLEGRSVLWQFTEDRDSVTGLRKRETFVPAVVDKVAREPGDWCCVAIDIQHFKIFNIWFGHEKGSYLISRIGNYLTKLEQIENAVAAYYGRDNFAVLLPYDIEKINQIYNDIRSFILSYSNMPGFLPALGVFRLP